jgi:hypothetical protein
MNETEERFMRLANQAGHLSNPEIAELRDDVYKTLMVEINNLEKQLTERNAALRQIQFHIDEKTAK